MENVLYETQTICCARSSWGIIWDLIFFLFAFSIFPKLSTMNMYYLGNNYYLFFPNISKQNNPCNKQECNKKHSLGLKQECQCGTEIRAQILEPDWPGFIQMLLLAHSATSGRSFNISDSASVKCRVALRISKNVCKSPNTVSGTYYALNQR